VPVNAARKQGVMNVCFCDLTMLGDQGQRLFKAVKIKPSL
jgi:hypothetical protein